MNENCNKINYSDDDGFFSLKNEMGVLVDGTGKLSFVPRSNCLSVFDRVKKPLEASSNHCRMGMKQ